MYQDLVKLAQDSLKPMLKLTENNTAMAVKLIQSQSQVAAEMLEGNLAHVQAMAEVKDLNAAVEMQQKYVESINEKMTTVAKENANVVESAMSEAGKIFEGSIADVQVQAKKTVESIEKEMSKVSKKAA